MRELPPLQKFAESLAAGAADATLEAMLPGLCAACVLDEARRLALQKLPERSGLLRAIAETASRDRASRLSTWQNDADKLRLRMRYRRTGAAAALLPPVFLGFLAEVFRSAGLVVAATLEKRPRPMIHLGPPLPLGAEGLDECLDVVLAAAPPDPDPLPALNRRAADGLEFLQLQPLPDYATAVLELGRMAGWRWRCPPELRAQAEPRVAAFLRSERFQIEKPGKEGGAKRMKQVEVRSLVQSMDWEGDILRFETRIEPGQALHPAKLLGGILGVDPAQVRGLVRTRIELAADPRLDQAERFEPKLKNMFEDAVLLKAGSNLKIIEEDDDEPLQLG